MDAYLERLTPAERKALEAEALARADRRGAAELRGGRPGPVPGHRAAGPGAGARGAGALAGGDPRRARPPARSLCSSIRAPGYSVAEFNGGEDQAIVEFALKLAAFRTIPREILSTSVRHRPRNYDDRSGVVRTLDSNCATARSAAI